jgi:hypothetical protein
MRCRKLFEAGVSLVCALEPSQPHGGTSLVAYHQEAFPQKPTVGSLAIVWSGHDQTVEIGVALHDRTPKAKLTNC